MFDTKEIKKAFEDFGKKVVKDARSNLAAKDKDVSGNLSRSLDYEFEGYKGGFRFVISMDDYGIFQDIGVKGTTSTYPETARAQEKYKTDGDSKPRFGSCRGEKGGLTKGINKWVRARRFQFQSRQEGTKGQFLSYESTAFIIRRSIWNKGIRATEFFSAAFENNFKKLTPKIEEAVSISVDKLLDFTIKENFKK